MKLKLCMLATLIALAPAAVVAQGSSTATVRLPVQTMATFNPLLARGSDAVYVNNPIFPGLARLDEDGEPQPHLALSWEIDESGLIWTFHLNPDARWHDGEAVTAEDVKFTMDAAVDPAVNSFRGSDLTHLNRVEVIDDHTVAFHFDEADSWFPYYMGETFGMLPAHMFEEVSVNEAVEFNTRSPIGSGPYMVTEVVEGSHMTLSAWEDYWGEAPAINTITFKVLPDFNTQVAQMLAGELDLITTFPAGVGPLSGRSGLEVNVLDNATTLMLNLNHDRTMFADKRVRQALVYGLDRQSIIDQVSGGLGIFATGPVTPDLVNYYNDEIPQRNYDPERAESLLDEAGWIRGADGIRERNGERLSINLLVDRGNPTREQVGLIAQQYYQQLGIEIDLEILERSVWASRLTQDRTFDAYISNRSYTPFVGRLARFWQTGSGTNLGNYSNSNVDRLFDEGKAAFDFSERQRIYRELQIAFEEDTPLVIVYFDPEIIVHSADLVIPETALMLALSWADTWHYDDETR